MKNKNESRTKKASPGCWSRRDLRQVAEEEGGDEERVEVGQQVPPDRQDRREERDEGERREGAEEDGGGGEEDHHHLLHRQAARSVIGFVYFYKCCNIFWHLGDEGERPCCEGGVCGMAGQD